MPYICVLEKCHKLEVLYLTRKEWTDHMEKEHDSVQYWLCLNCLRPIKYYNKDQFIQHIRDQHIGYISINEISFFADLCRYTAPQDLPSCPLCLPDTGFNSKRGKGEGSHIGRQDMLNHVAEHVHAFSLYSLPWLHPGDGELQYLGLTQSQASSDEDQWNYFDDDDSETSEEAGSDDSETPEADDSDDDSTDSPGSTEGLFEGLPEPVFDDIVPPADES